VGEADEGDVYDGQIGALIKDVHRKFEDVCLLEERNAGVAPEFRGKLIAACVNGDHTAGPLMQTHLGEASSGGADVEDDTPVRRGLRPRLQGCEELVSPAAHPRHVLTERFKDCIDGHALTGFVDDLTVHADSEFGDEALSAGT
jgi:hypothetical protein